MGGFLLLVSLIALVSAGSALGKRGPDEVKVRAVAVVTFIASIFLIGASLYLIPGVETSAAPVLTEPLPADPVGIPAPEPEFTSDPDPGKYFAQVERIIADYSVAMFTIGMLDRVEDPVSYALRNEQELRAAAQTLKDAAVEANCIADVPEKAEVGHDAFVGAMNQLFNSMFNFELGLDALVMAQYTAGGVFFELSTEYFDRGCKLMQEAFVLWNPVLAH